MVKNFEKLDRLIKMAFLSFFFVPFLGWLYKAVLNLPKTVLHLYAFVFFFIGIIFILKKRVRYFPKFTLFIMFYETYRILSLIFSGSYHHPLTFAYYSILYFSVAFTIMVISNTNFEKKFVDGTVKLIKLMIIAAFCLSLIQVFDSSFLNSWEIWGYDNLLARSIYGQRRTSIFGFVDPNELGLSFLPLCSAFIGVLVYRCEKTYVYTFYIILIGLTSFLTNTRYIMVGFCILTFQLFCAGKDRFLSFFKYLFFIMVGIIFIYFVLGSIGYNFKRFFYDRLLAEGSLTQTTRFKALDNFFIFFPEKPFLGTGALFEEDVKEASRFIGSSQIHVGYLAHLVSFGLVGSSLLFGFWFCLARKLYKNAKQTGYWGSFFSVLIFLWAQFTLVHYSILFSGIVFALIFDKYMLDQTKTRKSIKNSLALENRNMKRDCYF